MIIGIIWVLSLSVMYWSGVEKIVSKVEKDRKKDKRASWSLSISSIFLIISSIIYLYY